MLSRRPYYVSDEELLVVCIIIVLPDSDIYIVLCNVKELKIATDLLFKIFMLSKAGYFSHPY